MILKILTLLGALALFLYGLHLLGNGLQKCWGNKVRKFIPPMRKGRLSQIFSGLGLTAALQSSRAATMLVASSANAGLLSLSQAVGAIMGANIGATITVWIIALLSFTVGAVYLGFPLLALGFVFMVSKKDSRKHISEVIIGTAFIMIGVLYLENTLEALNSEGYVSELLQGWTTRGVVSILGFFILGLVVALATQSSSATIILSLICAGAGWLPIDMTAPLVLGANIGTAADASLSSTKGNVPARRAGLVHLLFNSIGAIIAILFIGPIGRLCSPMGTIFGTCAVHSLFNICSVCLLVWFTEPIVKLTGKIFPDQDGLASRLKYIGSDPVGSPAISITQAMKEAANFGEISHEGFGWIEKALDEEDSEKFEDCRKQLIEYEELSDKIEYEIASFLGKITAGEISGSESHEIKIIYRVIGELESLGDSLENISRILGRERIHKQQFNEIALHDIKVMLEKVDAAYKIMNNNLKQASIAPLTDIRSAYEAEDDINLTRETLRSGCLALMEEQSDKYQPLNYFLDLLSELESMGDFMINVSQALADDES